MWRGDLKLSSLHCMSRIFISYSHRGRLCLEKVSSWTSPQADLTAAEKLINDCGYHRRDEELADATRAILGNT